MQITPVANPNSDEKIYRVQDDDSLQGMFFLVVDRAERELSISSMDLNGAPDEADLLLISTRLPLDEPEENEDHYTWRYIDDEDLARKLVAITGEHAAIIAQDLGLSDDIAGDDWVAAMAAGGENPVSTAAPPMVRTSGYEFSFDAGELDSDGGEGGPGGGGDFGADGPAPGPDDVGDDEPAPEDGDGGDAGEEA